MGFRYIGTKTQIVERICDKIREIVGDDAHVADLMCGTGTVSAALRRSGFRVTANDLMTFSYHHARVALLFRSEPRFVNAGYFLDRHLPKQSCDSLFPHSKYEQMLLALATVPSKKGYFWREFSREGKPGDSCRPRNYFSPANAARIDGMRYWLQRLHDRDQIDDLEHSLLIHDLIMAANDCANIAGTYGHYLSRTIGRSEEPIVLRPSRLETAANKHKHKVTLGYAEEIATSLKCDLCYIDPPYMKRQYAANYHILETLARGDCPHAVGESGLRPWRDQYSNFCTKTRIRDSFRKILSTMNCDSFLVSYSEDGLLSIEELVCLFEEFGDVVVDTFKHKRFRSNNSSLKPTLTEYMIHLQKRRAISRRLGRGPAEHVRRAK